MMLKVVVHFDKGIIVWLLDLILLVQSLSLCQMRK